MHMNQFGSHAAAALAELDAAAIPDDVRMVLEQRITSDGETVDQYHVRIADGVVQVEDGPATDPDVILRQDAGTAEALQDGRLHAQQAFLTGRLSIEGDIDRLLEHGPLLAQLLAGESF